jgi:hypothetical protein
MYIKQITAVPHFQGIFYFKTVKTIYLSINILLIILNKLITICKYGWCFV